MACDAPRTDHGRPFEPGTEREAAMSIAMIRELWGYHHWANRWLFDVTRALGEAAAGRDMGPHFSEPTLRELFAHI